MVVMPEGHSEVKICKGGWRKRGGQTPGKDYTISLIQCIFHVTNLLIITLLEKSEGSIKLKGAMKECYIVLLS